MSALSNKVAIITGASSGIGRATALLFAREGAAVVLSARRQALLDALVGKITCAGGQAAAPDGWHDTIETNLTSAFLGVRYQVPAMIERGGGSLIFTSSFVGHTVGFPGMAAYAASKAGLIGLTQVLAAELGAKGIRANAILPGATDTPSNHANLPGAAPATRTFVEGLYAVKRMATAQEVAHSVLYLASDASCFTTRTALLVDGGVSVTRT